MKALPASHGGVTQGYIPEKFSESAPQICTFHNRFTAHEGTTDKSPALVRDVHTGCSGAGCISVCNYKTHAVKDAFQDRKRGTDGQTNRSKCSLRRMNARLMDMNV